MNAAQRSDRIVCRLLSGVGGTYRSPLDKGVEWDFVILIYLSFRKSSPFFAPRLSPGFTSWGLWILKQVSHNRIVKTLPLRYIGRKAWNPDSDETGKHHE
jgi:hypothetical protein